MSAQVKTVFNKFPVVVQLLEKDTLLRAGQAGAFVIEGNAKVNVEKTFSSRSAGAAGLGGSIFTKVVRKARTRVELAIGPTKVYGRIQELGGMVKPVFAKMLSWIDPKSGERIFANVVHIPARPYLRPAVDEHMNDIEKAISTQIERDIRGGLK